MLTENEKLKVTNAIKEAEKNTSGEVRLHIENHCKSNILDRASEVFAILNMHKTALRNGVLFYIALKDKKFAILGDAGINHKVPSNFWDSIKEQMQVLLKEGKTVDALATGIQLAGVALKSHFPYETDDINELSDEISFQDN